MAKETGIDESSAYSEAIKSKKSAECGVCDDWSDRVTT